MNRKIVQNAAWIIACKIAQAVLALVVTMLSARYLGPSNYGVITYAASVAAFLVPVIQLGLRSTLVQELIASPCAEGEIMGTALVMSSGASVLGIVGVAAFTYVANSGDPETILVCALYSVSLIFQATEMIQYWFQAKLLSKYTSLIMLAAYVFVSAYKIFLLVTGKSVYWFAVSQALDSFLISAASLAVYKRLGGQALRASLIRAKQLFSKSRYYILSGMMVVIFQQTDRVMLNLMVGKTVTGYYSAAIECTGMTGFVFSAIIDSIRPEVFSCKVSGSPQYEKRLVQLLSIVIYLSLAQSVFLAAFAKPVVRLLYGAEYAPAASLLRIATWYVTFSYMGAVRNIWLLAEERQTYLWKINLCGAAMNVVLNFVLIPVLRAEGAAIASVVTQFFTNFALCYLLRPLRPITGLIRSALDPRAFAACIRMVLRRGPEAHTQG